MILLIRVQYSVKKELRLAHGFERPVSGGRAFLLTDQGESLYKRKSGEGLIRKIISAFEARARERNRVKTG